MIVGALLSAVSFLLSGILIFYELKQIFVYYIITGGMVGMGFSFVYFPAITILDYWFDKKLGCAFGIATAGSGFGNFAFAPLIDFLLKTVGLGWSFITLGLVIGFRDALKRIAYNETFAYFGGRG